MDSFVFDFPLLNTGDSSEPVVVVSYYAEVGIFAVECSFVRCEYAMTFVNELYRQINCWTPITNYALLDLMTRLEADGQAYFPPPFIYMGPGDKGVDTPPAGDQSR